MHEFVSRTTRNGKKHRNTDPITHVNTCTISAAISLINKNTRTVYDQCTHQLEVNK